jgi:hypothetical protein
MKQFQTLGFKKLGKNAMLSENEKCYVVYNNPSNLQTKA